MTLYLSPDLTPHEIHKAKRAGIVGSSPFYVDYRVEIASNLTLHRPAGVKSYPRGVTTNSESGIESYTTYYPVFAAMEEEDMVLNLHGEIPSDASTNTCVLNAERQFLKHLEALHRDFPKLRIVLEHATTKEAVETVKSLGDTVACTITAHHLALTVDDWAGQSFNFCKPVAKYPDDRRALQDVVREGSDSAPHLIEKKAVASPDQPCAAGVYTSPILLPLVAHLLESFGALDNLEGFVSTNGRNFYKITEPELPSDGQRSYSLPVVKLCKTPSSIAKSLDLNEQKVVPFWAGKQLNWSLLPV
ncbi:Dihydroorotase Short=DHOase [Serendipita indica DSM 11827]|nr:Dihydroorotase Short=DHOase [Serendipita indica DSM 11827]